MKKIQKQIMFLPILCMLLMALVGCNEKIAFHQNKDSINVYFYNTQTGMVEVEEVKITLDTSAPSEQKMYSVIEALYKGPSSSQVVKPFDLHIKESSLKERIAYISFKDSYNTLDTQTQVAIRVSLVYSLTDLEFIDSVEFSVGDKPLTTHYGIKVGPVSRKDMLTSVLTPNPATIMQTITLYFAKENEDKLYKEERTISVNTNTPLEEYVIAELIKGPTTPGLIPTLPPDTQLNEIKTQELVCQIDLSNIFKNIQGTSPIKEELVIYSLVNSLTETPKVQKVMFLMDGKKQTEFSTVLNTGGLFERNEEIIADEL